MRRASAFFAAWAALLATLAGVFWLVFDPGGALSFLLPAFATGTALACAGASMLTRRAPARPDAGLAVPVCVLATGLGLAALGLVVGAWLSLMAALPVAFGLFGTLREVRG